jgi:hypothetical protein
MLAEATTAASTRTDVLAALHQASAQTGAGFDYLLGTAMRESSLKPQAKSTASSASGLFQFVDQTWLGLVKQHGARYGLGSCANAIEQGSDGRYKTTDPNDRQAILALRNDPRIAALMEGEYANESKASLESSLGRGVCNGELYAAHFLGNDAACRLIRMNESQPTASAASAFPQAASSNKSVFFHADGSAKSVREVYDWALKQPSGAQAADGPAATPRATASIAMPNGALTDDPQLASSQSEDWTSIRLYLATSPFGSTGPQSPFAVTPGVVDLLGSLKAPAGSPHAHRAS